MKRIALVVVYVAAFGAAFGGGKAFAQTPTNTPENTATNTRTPTFTRTITSTPTAVAATVTPSPLKASDRSDFTYLGLQNNVNGTVDTPVPDSKKCSMWITGAQIWTLCPGGTPVAH